jgi:hypothetical protein
LSDDAQRDLREVQEYFRLPSGGLVEKDLYVIKAIAASRDRCLTVHPRLRGGTALARAHKIIRRMSEDVDFKIVPLPAAPVSRSGIRRALGKLVDQVTAALHAAGFAFDPKDKARTHSQNENRYTVFGVMRRGGPISVMVSWGRPVERKSSAPLFPAVFVTFLQSEIGSYLCSLASRRLDRPCMRIMIRLDGIC